MRDAHAIESNLVEARDARVRAHVWLIAEQCTSAVDRINIIIVVVVVAVVQWFRASDPAVADVALRDAINLMMMAVHCVMPQYINIYVRYMLCSIVGIVLRALQGQARVIDLSPGKSTEKRVCANARQLAKHFKFTVYPSCICTPT